MLRQEVVGSGAVTIIGVRLHVLTEGAVYDIRTRKAYPPERR